MRKIFKITVRRNINCNGEHLPAGANVEIITKSGSTPFSSVDSKEKIREAFEHKYGVDMEKMKGHVNSIAMDAEEL